MGIQKVFKCQMDVMEFLVKTPIGIMKVKSCGQGLHQLHQVDEINDSNFSPNPQTKVELLTSEQADALGTCPPAVTCIRWLTSYFEQPFGVSQKPPLCLPDLNNATFQQKVWITLSNDVKAGETVSYGHLAQMVDNPKAARAVGTAMMSNPFMLVVPCHRVIRSDGNIGLFAHGKRQKVKRWLLDHEKAILGT